MTAVTTWHNTFLVVLLAPFLLAREYPTTNTTLQHVYLEAIVVLLFRLGLFRTSLCAVSVVDAIDIGFARRDDACTSCRSRRHGNLDYHA